VSNLFYSYLNPPDNSFPFFNNKLSSSTPFSSFLNFRLNNNKLNNNNNKLKNYNNNIYFPKFPSHLLYAPFFYNRDIAFPFNYYKALHSSSFFYFFFLFLY
jgi:hypothetical protein